MLEILYGLLWWLAQVDSEEPTTELNAGLVIVEGG